jgi:hypothetical protein
VGGDRGDFCRIDERQKMIKKSILSALGAIGVLAVMALPTVAEAGEPQLKCTSTPCTYSVTSTGRFTWSAAGGDTIACSSVTGSGSMSQLEGATGQVQLLMHECKEQNTIFTFACSNTGTSGNMTTNVMTTHDVYLDAKASTQGVLFTNLGITFTCAGGFMSNQQTGSLLTHLETPCGATQNHLTVNATATGHGQQTFKQVTGSGPTFAIESKTNHTGNGSYEAMAWTFTIHLNFNQNVTPTC